jgi:quinol monooxygenase YgiN
MARMKLFHVAMAAFAVVGLASTARAADADEAVYSVTYVDVMPAARASAAAALRTYRTAAAAEHGNRAALALQETTHPGRFVIVETWETKGDFDTHQTGAALQRFHAAIAPIRHSPEDQRVHRGFLVSPAPSQAKMPGGQLHVVTHVDVVPPRQAETEAALRSFVEQARRDPGCLRYDVFQQTARPNHFTVYAVWRTKGDFAAHERSSHRLHFRETMAPYLGALYDERFFTALN